MSVQYSTSASMSASQRRLSGDRGSTVRRHSGTGGAPAATSATAAAGSGATAGERRARHSAP